MTPLLLYLYFHSSLVVFVWQKFLWKLLPDLKIIYENIASSSVDYYFSAFTSPSKERMLRYVFRSVKSFPFPRATFTVKFTLAEEHPCSSISLM